MKKKWIVMLAVMMLFAFTACVVAAPAVQQVTATLATNFKFALDGKAWAPKDVDGSDMYPLVYEGRTYLPVRAIGEALGIKVDWDKNTRTVILDKATVTPTPGNGTSPALTTRTPGDIIKTAIGAFSPATAHFDFRAPIADTPYGDIAAKVFGTASIDANKKALTTYESHLGALDSGDKKAESCPLSELLIGPEATAQKIVSNGILVEVGNNYVITVFGVPCPDSIVDIFTHASKVRIHHDLIMDCKVFVDKTTGKISSVEDIILRGQASTALGEWDTVYSGSINFTY